MHHSLCIAEYLFPHHSFFGRRVEDFIVKFAHLSQVRSSFCGVLILRLFTMPSTCLFKSFQGVLVMLIGCSFVWIISRSSLMQQPFTASSSARSPIGLISLMFMLEMLGSLILFILFDNMFDNTLYYQHTLVLFQEI